MTKDIPELSKSVEDVYSFFDALKIGDVFSFNTKDYLSEEVIELASEYGKMVLFFSPGSILFDELGNSTGIVIINTDEHVSKIEDVQKTKVRRELLDCYKRIEDLETQLGLRGSERLEKCEYCKNPLYTYQTWVSTDSGGSAHAECSLSKEIERFTGTIKKKEDVVKKWTTESQQLANEAHTLRVDKKKLAEELQAIKEVLNTTDELLKETQVENAEQAGKIEVFSEQLEIITAKNGIASSLKELHVQHLIKVVEIFKRTIRLLGNLDGGEFTPLPQIKMPGELRVEVRGWCQPIHEDMCDLLMKVESLI